MGRAARGCREENALFEVRHEEMYASGVSAAQTARVYLVAKIDSVGARGSRFAAAKGLPCRRWSEQTQPQELAMSTFFKGRNVRGVVASAALLVVGGSAFAGDLKVHLIGGEETPPVTSSASGTGTITIAADKSVSGTIKTSGIEGTVAHIHVGAPGQSGPPIITLDKGADGVWSVPAGSKLTDEQYASFKAGNLYVNVHSAEHKPGEIRAQLKP
jgi:hypothetical protein